MWEKLRDTHDLELCLIFLQSFDFISRFSDEESSTKTLTLTSARGGDENQSLILAVGSRV